MSIPAVLIAVRERLGATAGLPVIIWPNQSAKVSAPYLTFDNGPKVGQVRTTDGLERFQFRPLVSILIEGNSYTSEADGYVELIQTAFKAHTRLFDGANEIGRCDQTPLPDGGFPNGNLWRVTLSLRVSSHQRF